MSLVKKENGDGTFSIERELPGDFAPQKVWTPFDDDTGHFASGYRVLRKLATAPEGTQRRVFELMDAALPGPVTSEEQFDARVELLRLLMDAGM